MDVVVLSMFSKIISKFLHRSIYEKWRIKLYLNGLCFIDVAGIVHHVDFNGLTTKPCVTNGWNALGNFYQWTEVYMLTLFYYGQNTFLMLTAPGELDTSDFPSFHSMSTQLCHDHSYLVFINENNYNSSELVRSFPSFNAKYKWICCIFYYYYYYKFMFVPFVRFFLDLLAIFWWLNLQNQNLSSVDP
jgi:hypothetical protein